MVLAKFVLNNTDNIVPNNNIALSDQQQYDCQGPTRGRRLNTE